MKTRKKIENTKTITCRIFPDDCPEGRSTDRPMSNYIELLSGHAGGLHAVESNIGP
jgi:hypothetical protein